MFIALFILGLCVIILGNWLGYEKKNYVGVLVTVLGWIIYATSFLFLDGAVRQSDTPKHQTIEYSASEYELKLRIVEFEGQRDTTYVLVKKTNE